MTEGIKIFNKDLPYCADTFKEGTILLINKPRTWSSFDVVNKTRILLRRYMGLRKIKVGHAGTLDPLAEGLLILCTGKATKIIDTITGANKEYLAEITFGGTTPSFDLETKVEKEHKYEHINNEMIKEALNHFKGVQLQTPPQYSAIWMNGQRAYNLARKGDEVKMSQREVNFLELELLEYTPPVAKVRILCSKGTYIRSFANDLGEKLNSGAYLSYLRRTISGQYKIDNAISPENFEESLSENQTI